MASDTKKSRLQQQQQLVSSMIKQGFISDPFLSLTPPPFLSPPPPPNPTLFQIMAHDPPKPKIQPQISAILARAPFHRYGMGDVRLTVAAKPLEDGEPYKVLVDVHRRVLAEKSRFFAENLRRSGTHSVEILDCDDVAVYLEAVVLMYYGEEEVKKRLLGMNVSKVVAILEVSSAIMFDDGVRACLEYLEAVPWSEEEEEMVVSHVSQYHFEGTRTDDVLQRVTAKPSTSAGADDIFLRLSSGILQAKDDKARNQMKGMIYRLLKEDRDNPTLHNRLDMSKDTLYHLCDRCLSSLILCLSGATCIDESRGDRGVFMGEIAREADNMQWIVDILIDRKMGDEFVKLWADQKELADLHSKIPIMYRHEISKITAQLCISMGRGQVLVPKDTRFALISTWLEALYDDFAWMIRAGKSVDKNLVEEGLSQTILTLPLPQQQSILLNWFERFLNRGSDCPNIQRAFEIWWRRAFVKQYTFETALPLTVCDMPN